MTTIDPPRDVIRCPIHDATDCSPLLNGCSIPNRLADAFEAGRALGYEHQVEDRREDGECLTVHDHLAEAQRMVNADPVVADPDLYQEVRTENLLSSIAHSLYVLAEALVPEHDQP